MKNSFRINLDDNRILYLKEKDGRLEKVVDYIGPIECSLHEDGFAFLAGEIIGQMLSNKVGDIIEGRVKELSQGNISPERVIKLSREQLRNTGMSYSKVESLHNLAQCHISGELDTNEFEEMSDNDVFKKLTSLKGVGSWTAKMYLLFFLGRDDVLPYEDVAFLQAYKWLYQTDDISKNAVRARCACWAPYSSIAARYLYRVLDSGLTRMDIHDFIDM